ncbi:unnamed protein product [Amoebophrya sp. A120]|nr:unnamed protein product [Amoebophrya sp. A120]|eukprot:GSA120T00016946001.1
MPAPVLIFQKCASFSMRLLFCAPLFLCASFSVRLFCRPAPQFLCAGASLLNAGAAAPFFRTCMPFCCAPAAARLLLRASAPLLAPLLFHVRHFAYVAVPLCLCGRRFSLAPFFFHERFFALLGCAASRFDLPAPPFLSLRLLWCAAGGGVLFSCRRRLSFPAPLTILCSCAPLFLCAPFPVRLFSCALRPFVLHAGARLPRRLVYSRATASLLFLWRHQSLLCKLRL